MKANGKEILLSTPTTLKAFLTEQGYNIERVVVEKNGAIVTNEHFEHTQLSNDDRIEIVHFVGGG